MREPVPALVSTTRGPGPDTGIGRRGFVDATFELERVDRTRDGRSDGGFVAAIALVCAGPAVSMSRPGAAGLMTGAAIAALGVTAYALAMRSAPATKYFRYAWLDEASLHHRERPDAPVARFAICEIDAVDAAFDDGAAVRLGLRRTGRRGVPIFLSMASREHALRLVARLEREPASRSSNPPAETTDQAGWAERIEPTEPTD